jgi:hypothetical protein
MIYSLILRNNTIIADYSETEGDFQEVSMKIVKSLEKNYTSPKENCLVVNYEQYDFNIMLDKQLIYLCITKLNSSILFNDSRLFQNCGVS